MKTLKEICETLHIDGPSSVEEYGEAVRMLRDRCSPATMLLVLEALENIALWTNSNATAQRDIDRCKAALSALNNPTP